MVDYTSLALLVVGAYVLVQYGPQIAQGLQQASGAAAPAPTPVDTTAASAPAPAAPVDTTVPATVAPAPVATVPGEPTTIVIAGGSTLQNCIDQFGRRYCATIKSGPCVTGQGDGIQRCAGTGNAKAKAVPFGVTGGVIAGAGGGGNVNLSINKRAPKTPIPSHAAAAAKSVASSVKNPQCHGNPCAKGFCFGTGGIVKCSNQGTVVSNVGYYDGYSQTRMGPAWYETQRENVYQASMTQIVTDPKTGKPTKITTIDPYFPAGFYLAEANRTSSLHEPALH